MFKITGHIPEIQPLPFIHMVTNKNNEPTICLIYHNAYMREALFHSHDDNRKTSIIKVLTVDNLATLKMFMYNYIDISV